MSRNRQQTRRSLTAANLIYTDPSNFRIRRRRIGKQFVYEYQGERRVRGQALLRRIQTLAIPPAWTDVLICAHRHGHIQAVGRDARGRKQYIYHTRWREHRDAEKFNHLLDFARVLPRIRRRVRSDLRQPGLGKSKALAAVVRLLELSRIRVGNEEYARQNRSFGLTTLRNRHVRSRGSTLQFRFRGKSGRHHTVHLREPRLARVVARYSRIPGRQVFQYFAENGRRCRLKAEDVNDYLRDITGQDFTAKDFRTWAGTVLAVEAIRAPRAAVSSRREMNRVIRHVADQLGNTPAVCRRSYVHPKVFEALLSRPSFSFRPCRTVTGIPGLRAGESAVVRLLRQSRKAA